MLKKTPLNQIHRLAGAKMVPFGGWEMPVEYSGLIAEHNAVRGAAGLFDVSHMGQFEFEGPGALPFLQRTTCNDVRRLGLGQAQYTALPMPNGAPVDDIILYRRGEERYMMVVNASNSEKDLRWLRDQSPTGLDLKDRSLEFGLLALQGPRAQDVLQPLTPLPLSSLKSYHSADVEVAGHNVMVARTGYTGEDGFEILVPADNAAPLWQALQDAGRDKGLVPVGLGARDTLRLEARMCLYGNDIDETTTLIEAGLGWIVCLDEGKGDFIGRTVLESQKKEGVKRRLSGFEMVGRGIARHGYPVTVGDEEVGSVTSGTYAPYLQKSIGLCYLPSERAAVGSSIDIQIRGNKVAAKVVPTPFYKRPRPDR